MHEIFRSLLSCRTKRAVENALLLRRSRELSTHPFILPWHESFFSACIANLHIDWLQPCGISGLVDTYSVIFLGHAYFSFFAVFKSVHTRKRNVAIVFARDPSFSSPSTRKRWQFGVVSKNLYYVDRFQKSAFQVLEITVCVWTEGYNGEKKIFLFKNIREPF